MTPSTMVCHLIDSIDVATGKAPARIRKSFMASRLMRWLIIYVVPWPKGKAKTVPEMLKTQPPGTSDTSRIATDNINNPNSINPIFDLGGTIEVAEAMVM